MKILILGLGVIGTTYAYLFQKAGAETEHFIRESKRTDFSTAEKTREARSSGIPMRFIWLSAKAPTI